MDDGKVYWIEVMGQDRRGSEGTQAACERWHEEYPAENVVCLADENYDFTTWMNVSGFPWAMYVNEDMTIEIFDSRRDNLVAPLDAVNAL